MTNKIKRKLVFIFLIVIFFFVALIQINFLDYEKPIPYARIKEISFKNFRGLEFFQKSLHGNKSFAYVYTSIDYKFEGDSVYVQSFFHPSRSYVFNNKVYSKELLVHEMYHFKIAELHSRLAKKRISEFKHPTEEAIEDIISSVKKEESDFQIRYDNDTFHSYVMFQQKKYEKEVDSLLALYENFKTPKIYINEH